MKLSKIASLLCLFVFPFAVEPSFAAGARRNSAAARPNGQFKEHAELSSLTPISTGATFPPLQQNSKKFVDFPLSVSRRRAMVAASCFPLLVWLSRAEPSFASQSMQTTQFAGSSSSPSSRKRKINPQTAFNSLLKAQDELRIAAREYLVKGDYGGLRTYLLEEATNMNQFEMNAQALLASNLLATEDKKAIGTIRTYGVGADVMIMYGALLQELENSNAADAAKYLERTYESLAEVIAICQNSGLP